MSLSVKFIDKSSEFIKSQEKDYSSATSMMCSSIVQLARILAPVDTGDLRASGRVVKEGNNGSSAVFGGGKVKYARRRHYENRKNPQTLRYLERAGTSVSKKGIKNYL